MREDLRQVEGFEEISALFNVVIDSNHYLNGLLERFEKVGISKSSEHRDVKAFIGKSGIITSEIDNVLLTAERAQLQASYLIANFVHGPKPAEPPVTGETLRAKCPSCKKALTLEIVNLDKDGDEKDLILRCNNDGCHRQGKKWRIGGAKLI